MNKTQRLTLAEYASKDSKSSDTRRGAQALFMEAAGRVCPAFLLHLRDNVLPLLETNTLDSERVNQELQAWLQAFHVSEEQWLISNALKTLGHWQRYPQAAAELRWYTVGLGGWSGVSRQEREFELRDPGGHRILNPGQPSRPGLSVVFCPTWSLMKPKSGG